MTEHDANMSRDITLDELTALCDEMVSLSRAGIPIDRGLLQLAQDLPKRLSAHATQIGEQLQAGKSLADVVSMQDSPFPAVYRSVVEAGLRSGNLSVALEGIARISRQLAELRRLVASALAYPLILLILLSLISVGLVRHFGPILYGILLDINGRGSETGWAAKLMASYSVISEWFWVLPVALLAVAVLVLLMTQFLGQRGLSKCLEFTPGARRLVRNSRLQAFVEVLSLLVQQQVPLHQAVSLAGAASGDTNLQADSDALAAELERGDAGSDIPAVSSGRGSRGIPPLIRWSLLNSQRPDNLVRILDRAGDSYRLRTQASVVWLRKYLPILFSFVFGSLVTALYAMTVFLPWFTMLRSLSEAMGDM